jgi:tetratricopeptide (TPR) repeat protein
LSRRVGDNRKLFGILSMICGGHLERGEFASACEMLDEMRTVAEKTEDMGYVSAGSVMAVWPTVALGRLAQACAYAEQSVTEYDRGGQAIAAWILRPDVLGLHLGGLALWPFGYPDKALARAEDALARARSLDPFNRACSLHVVAEVCAYRGELARAFKANRDELEICTRYGIGTSILGGTGHALMAQGWLLTLRGEFEEGLAQLRCGIEVINGTGQKYCVPGYLGRLANGYLAAGDESAASEALAQELALAGETGERAWDAELRRIEGAIAQKQGRSEEAARAFREAIKIARKQSAKSWELRAKMSLARLLTKQGRRDEARAMLADIYGWFTEGFDTADLKDAKALLDELAG